MAYTHISLCSDSKTENLSKYRDKIVKCRIVGFSEFDGMALASLKESIISAKIFSIAESKLDQIKGKIKKVDKKAVVCSIGEDVTGIILPEHLAEVKLQNLEDHLKWVNLSIAVCYRLTRSITKSCLHVNGFW